MNHGTPQVQNDASEFAVGVSNSALPGGRAPSAPCASFSTDRSSSVRSEMSIVRTTPRRRAKLRRSGMNATRSHMSLLRSLMDGVARMPTNMPLLTELSASPRRLAIPHISRWQGVNPKGILSLSPGLRGASYPGCGRSKESPTLKGLQHLARTATTRQQPGTCCNPFRVDYYSATKPRVARASQPWARRYHSFGIKKRHKDLWVMASPAGRASALTGSVKCDKQ